LRGADAGAGSGRAGDAAAQEASGQGGEVMRARGAAIQGGLAALGLVVAYTTWQREPERSPGEAVVLDVAKGDVSLVRYDDGTKWVELSRDKDAVWLKVSKNDTAKTPERELRGNEGAGKL